MGVIGDYILPKEVWVPVKVPSYYTFFISFFTFYAQYTLFHNCFWKVGTVVTVNLDKNSVL